MASVFSPKGPVVYWPSWRYGPGGQAAIFECAEDVPKGWEDHPSKVGAVVESANGIRPTALVEEESSTQLAQPRRRPVALKRTQPIDHS